MRVYLVKVSNRCFTELPMYPRLGFSVVDVRDVAQCQILAMQKEEYK